MQLGTDAASAAVLEQHNTKRRSVERELVTRVEAAAAGNDDRVLVLAGDDWHPGVLGIVAARMAETVGRPTILISFDGETGRGSGRSPGGIHLRKAMRECAPLLVSFGGHAAAAGLEIRREHLDSFRRAINEAAENNVEPHEPPGPDGIIEFDELHPREIRRLDLLGPFGAGNPRPSFVTSDVRVVGRPTVDTRGIDLRFRVAKTGIVVPARLRRGARHFETLREIDFPVLLVHSPRLSWRSEEGPVELTVSRLEQANGNGSSQPDSLVLA